MKKTLLIPIALLFLMLTGCVMDYQETSYLYPAAAGYRANTYYYPKYPRYHHKWWRHHRRHPRMHPAKISRKVRKHHPKPIGFGHRTGQHARPIQPNRPAPRPHRAFKPSNAGRPAARHPQVHRPTPTGAVQSVRAKKAPNDARSQQHFPFGIPPKKRN